MKYQHLPLMTYQTLCIESFLLIFKIRWDNSWYCLLSRHHCSVLEAKRKRCINLIDILPFNTGSLMPWLRKFLYFWSKKACNCILIPKSHYVLSITVWILAGNIVNVDLSENSASFGASLSRYSWSAKTSRIFSSDSASSNTTPSYSETAWPSFFHRCADDLSTWTYDRSSCEWKG